VARKIKPPDELPSKAWLMSFGDTMTTLLAFFIVLCSMAEDQSGANLHTGTGSFLKTLSTGGMGSFSGDSSNRALHFDDTSPLYMTDTEEEAEPGSKNRGPDDEDNGVSSKDREQEEFMRCLNEMEKIANLDVKASTVGETTFDFFEKLDKEPPFLPSSFPKIATRIFPLLRKDTHRVELIVWATTPGNSARQRASIQASAIVQEILGQASVSNEDAQHIVGISRTWPYKDIKRPILSVVIRRVDTN